MAPQDFAGLKVGNKVKVILKPGTNIAKSVKLRTPKKDKDPDE